MQSRVYIVEDTFSTLVAFLQKGLEKGICYFINDTQDLIKDRLWTFSSPAFIPNVKFGDNLAKNYKVPIIISNRSEYHESEGYSTILFEPLMPFECSCTIFVKNKQQAEVVIGDKTTCTVFSKINGKWQEITL